jgi:hypothetical protein
MRIRDLQWEEVPAWPPAWWISDKDAAEEGFLEDVYLSKDKMPFCISVDANHFGAEKKGIIIMDYPAHLEILYNKLKENVGRPLSEIGDMEIDFGLPMSKKGPKQVRPQKTPDMVMKKSQINGA